MYDSELNGPEVPTTRRLCTAIVTSALVEVVDLLSMCEIDIDSTAADGEGNSVSYRSKTKTNDIELREPPVTSAGSLGVMNEPSWFHATESGPETPVLKPEEARRQSNGLPSDSVQLYTKQASALLYHKIIYTLLG